MYALGEVFDLGDARARWPGRVRQLDHSVEMGPQASDESRALWPRLVREVGVGWNLEVEAEPEGSSVAGPTSVRLDEPSAADLADTLADPGEELYVLGERCAQAYMQADTLHYRAMKLLTEFDRRRGWEDTGFSSTAEWLAWRIGIQLGAARERLRTALALQVLPLTSEAMQDGELSFTKVRALTRVATPQNEATLLDFARAGSAANLERMVRGWKKMDRKTEVTAEQIRHRSRRFSAWVDDDGMVVVRGRLDPEVGALLMRAVEAAGDALYRDRERGEERADAPLDEHKADPEMDKTTPEQRRADAVGLIAERGLAAGFAGDAPTSGSRAERYQVMLHVDADTLREDGEPGLSELEDGTRVSAETSRRIACDSGLVAIGHGSDGQVLGAGRRKRTVSPSVRRALEARDRGCRFPGCGLRFTDAHHVKHWADGGETSLRNLILLCKRHHRAVHEGGVRVCIDVTGKVVFFTPKGKAFVGAPARGVDAGWLAREGAHPEKASAETAGEGKATAAGVRPTNPETAGNPGALTPGLLRPPAGAPRWNRDADIPWAVEARAWEALDSG